MTLAKRLTAMEARIRALETWKANVEQALVEEEDQEQPIITLDGDIGYGERDQDQPL